MKYVYAAGVCAAYECRAVFAIAGDAGNAAMPTLTTSLILTFVVIIDARRAFRCFQSASFRRCTKEFGVTRTYARRQFDESPQHQPRFGDVRGFDQRRCPIARNAPLSRCFNT
jgi:hypothetical protein